MYSYIILVRTSLHLCARSHVHLSHDPSLRVAIVVGQAGVYLDRAVHSESGVAREGTLCGCDVVKVHV